MVSGGFKKALSGDLLWTAISFSEVLVDRVVASVNSEPILESDVKMGLTMLVDDLLQTLKKPFRLAYGALLQFSILPFLGYFLAKFLSVNSELTVGAVLVGSAPGGTASNVITYLSKGDLAYSVSMTTFSTLVSPIMTPLHGGGWL